MKKKMNGFLFSSLLLVGGIGFSHVMFAEEVENKSSVAIEEAQSSIQVVEQSVPQNTEAKEEEDSKNQETKKEVLETQKNVEKLVGEQKGEAVPVDSKPTPSLIRQELLKAEYGISQAELDKYSDEQLEQTMTLFTRYNYDIIGMDYGSYVRLLNTLFVDKTVNVNDALTQLSFEPSSFSGYAEMISQIDRLQTYLKTLYPVNSSFLPGVNLSNDELINRLNELQKFEDNAKAKGETISFGRIAGIINYVPTKEIIDSSSTDDVSDTSGTSTTNSKKQIVAPTSSSSKKEGNLPKTGEVEETIMLVSLGLFTIAGVGFILVRKI